MEKLTETIEKENKSVLKTFLVIIISVILIDFFIFICNNYFNKWPYLTNLIVILLTMFICSLIVLKLFSKYSYILTEQEFIFYRVIGKRNLELLRFNLEDLVHIEPYNKEKGFEKPMYKFIFPKEYENAYVGKFISNGTYHHFLFKPSKEMVNLINARLNKEV
ncbi:MAG TPA: hypothetical protein VK071_04495 [Tissierellales bacterium]|nr:hypothetical protein [Tissierellales bacterium]